MRYASILKAELGWKIVLVDSDGNPHTHDIRKWGVRFDDGKLIPLDNQDESMYRKNFVMLIDPNERVPSEKEIALKSKRLRWLLDGANPALEPELWAEHSLEKSGT